MAKKSTAVGVLVFGGLFLQYMMRTTIAIAIPAALDGYRGLYTNLEGIFFKWNGGTSKLNYTQLEVGAIFGTFYIGYIPSRLLGGHLAFSFPALRVFQVSLLLTSLLHIWAPVGLGVHLSVIIIIRILRGLTEGIAFPAAFTLLVEWLPTFTADRARIITTVPIVMYLGFGTGFFLNSMFLPLFGWFSPFALFGIIGVLWTAMIETLNCAFNFTKGPTEDDMKEMVQDAKTSSKEDLNTDGRRKSNNLPIPWRAMMTSGAVLSVLLCDVVLKCGQHLVLLYAPTIFAQVGKRYVIEIGLLAMVPPLLVAFLLPITLVVIPNLNIVELPRKAFNTIGFFGFAAGLMAVAIRPEWLWMTVFLSLGLGLTAFALAAGYNMTPMEIAPEYATIIRGVSAAVGTAVGASYIIFVGWATRDKTKNEWLIVIVTEACFLTAAGVVFIICGRSSVQSWARPWERSDEPPRPQLHDTSSADRLITPTDSLSDLLEPPVQDSIQPEMDDYYKKSAGKVMVTEL